MKKVTRGNVTIKLWDIGGQPRFRSMWERYCRGVNSIVYVSSYAEPHCQASILISLNSLRHCIALSLMLPITKSSILPAKRFAHTFHPSLSSIHLFIQAPHIHIHIHTMFVLYDFSLVLTGCILFILPCPAARSAVEAAVGEHSAARSCQQERFARGHQRR